MVLSRSRMVVPVHDIIVLEHDIAVAPVGPCRQILACDAEEQTGQKQVRAV
jgi:hypothetical protein